MNAPRDEFSERQIRRALEVNAAEVVDRWRSTFALNRPHYICEECRFVSADRNLFEVDHIVPCARGGGRDRHGEDLSHASQQRRLESLHRAGLNIRLLCVGCNQAKKVRQFVPPGAGYAYRRPELDRNPDHLYHGRPTVGRKEIEEHPAPYDPARYRDK